MSAPRQILFCNCTYAQVVPAAVKAQVLEKLCGSGQSFEAVADLCEMSARQEPALQRLAAAGSLKVAACYPRAVQWLFASAHAPLSSERTQVLNMRIQSADEVAAALLRQELQPNLPPHTAPPPKSPPPAAL